MNKKTTAYEPNMSSIDKQLDKIYNDIIAIATGLVLGATTVAELEAAKRKFRKEVLKYAANLKLSDVVVNSLVNHTMKNLKQLDRPGRKVPTTNVRFQRNVRKGYVKLSNHVERTLKQNASMSSREFNKQLRKTITEVNSGKKSLDQAAADLAKKIEKDGLAKVKAGKSGRMYNPKAWAKMTIRTEQNRVHMENSRMYAQENGMREVFLVSTHQHRAPRPLCAEDEGKVVDMTGNIDTFVDGLGVEYEVYDVGDTTYREPAGQQGINCTHTWTLIEGGYSIIREVAKFNG